MAKNNVAQQQQLKTPPVQPPKIVIPPEKKEENKEKLKLIGDEEIGRDLFRMIRAKYKIIYVRSYEESRVITAFRLISSINGYDLFQWDCQRGLLNPHTGQQVQDSDSEIHSQPIALLGHIVEFAKGDHSKIEDEQMSSGGRIFMLLDFHNFLQNMPPIERLFKEFSSYNNARCHIIIVAPTYVCPDTLTKEFTLVDFPAPSKAEIEGTLDRVIGGVRVNYPDIIKSAESKKEELIKAAQGLTLMEIENAFAKSVVSTRSFDIPTILEEKRQIIKKTGILEFRKSRFTFDDVGGLDTLKHWLTVRRLAFKEEARTYGLDAPKGLLMVGTPGCVIGSTKIKVRKISENGKYKIFTE